MLAFHVSGNSCWIDITTITSDDLGRQPGNDDDDSKYAFYASLASDDYYPVSPGLMHTRKSPTPLFYIHYVAVGGSIAKFLFLLRLHFSKGFARSNSLVWCSDFMDTTFFYINGWEGRICGITCFVWIFLSLEYGMTCKGMDGNVDISTSALQWSIYSFCVLK